MPNQEAETKDVSSPLAKFCIGVLAGCAAIAIPRLSTFLTSSEEASGIYFPGNYITGAILFAILIGLLVMVMEFKIPKPPKETLFAALAVPGLIAGSLNTAVESKEASRIHQKMSVLSEGSLNENNISIETIDAMRIIPIDINSTDESTTSTGIHFEFISSAHAEGYATQMIEKSDAYQLAVQREKPMYTISIDSADSYASGLEKVTAIRNQNINAVLVETNGRYEILSSNEILSKTDATIEAIKLKKRLGVKPKLLKVK